ncbi:MAG: leucine-rich repeat protein [Bacteroidetes bacterium]|nr:leucine-rich repeat protein [Bacteroidota bacterium]
MLKQAPLHRRGTVPLYGGAGVIDSHYDEQPPLHRSATVPLPWRGDICESKWRGGKLTRGLAPVIIAIVLAISMSANLSAQTPITFNAASPPTLTQTDVNTQLSGISYPFSAIINSPITALGNNVFRGGPTNITNRDYLVSVNAPDVITIGNQAFYECTSLESATFSLAETIENYAFYQCSSLESINIPSATTIKNYVFQYCSSLKTISFPSVTTIGESTFFNCTSLENVSLPSAITIDQLVFRDCSGLKSVEFPSVETVGVNAFTYCSSLETVSLPSAITIGDYAFRECSSLKNVSLPSAITISARAFNLCTSLENVSLPSVKTISNYAFTNCTSLKSVELPSVETISNFAFMYCTSLESITLGAEPPELETYVFYNTANLSDVTLHIPAGSLCLYEAHLDWGTALLDQFADVVEDVAVLSVDCPPYADQINHIIGDNEFWYDISCPALVNVKCDDAISIGSSAFGRSFYSCLFLKSVEFPIAESIGALSFYNCTSLESADFPVATAIGNSAFQGCSSLENVYIPNAEYIGESAFEYCSSLVSVEFPLVETIDYDVFRLCSSLENVYIPNAEYIGETAFAGCTDLQSVEFPLAATIDNLAFSFCTNLVNVEFPLVKTIGIRAFQHCTNLVNVEFPLVKTIGNSAFELCSALENITLGPVPPTLGSSVFDAVDLGNVTLHIPEGSLCAYENHSSWGSTFLDQFADVVEYPVDKPVTYELKVSANNGTAIIGTSGTQTSEDVPCGTTRKITAIADDCYQFDGWTSGSFTSSTNPLDVYVVSDTTLTANFILILPAPTYTLTLDYDGDGTVTGSGGPLTAITCGDSRTITATPNSCYQFVNWTNADNTELSTNATEIITVVKDSTIKANFTPAPTYTLTLADDGGGTATGSGGSLTAITCGDSRIITATADDCYEFVNWTNADNTELSTNATETITLFKDTVLTAHFTPVTATYTLSVNSSNTTMGTVSRSDTKALYTCGESITLTATPTADYVFKGWKEGGAIVYSGSSYIFNIGADRTLTAMFDVAKKKSRIKKINVKKGRVRIKPQP